MADDGILHCVVVVRGRPTPGKRTDSEGHRNDNASGGVV
jgi:hypothetical protein